MVAIATFEFDPHIDEYMRMVEKDEINSCREQKLLMKFLRKKLSNPDIIIDHKIIKDSVTMPKKYFPFDLYEWEKFINAFIYGVRYKTGYLVFDEYFLMLGRGAGKNGFISWNSFFMLSKSLKIKRYNIDLIATSEDQAMRSFKDVYEVIKDNGLTGKDNAFTATKELIQHNTQLSTLEFNTSNAKTKDSKRPGCVIFDEIHAYENYSNIAVHIGGLGKVKDPRKFYITTDGNIRNSVIDDKKLTAISVLNGDKPKSTMFPFICRIDSLEEADNLLMWEKANPSLRYNETLKREVEKEYEDSKSNSTVYMSFMAKRMNFPVEDTYKAVATWDDIYATDKPLPEDLDGIEAIGALDYADVRDFCSVGALFKKDGKRYWKQHSFMFHTAPKLQGINQEIIDEAIQAGVLTVIHEGSIKPEHCVDWFLSQCNNFNFKKIVMDKHRSLIMQQKLGEAGFETVVVPRGPIIHSMLSPLVDEIFINRTLVFGSDPLMRWYCGNVFKESQPNGNIIYQKIDKEKRKTDGFFALLHALSQDAELSENTEFDPSLFASFVF